VPAPLIELLPAVLVELVPAVASALVALVLPPQPRPHDKINQPVALARTIIARSVAACSGR
jgi:hypothetical protein